MPCFNEASEFSLSRLIFSHMSEVPSERIKQSTNQHNLLNVSFFISGYRPMSDVL
jgi:hypothetical protein